jgi:prevent-host-death family protein
MQIAVSDAKAQLTELVRRAEEGEDIVLTRHGHPVARLTPVKPAGKSEAERREIIAAIRTEARAKAVAGPSAARSQDFLYGEDGLPA